MNFAAFLSALAAIRCRCGGTLTAQDHQRRDWLRYEVYCRNCGTCDPNGWGSRAIALKEARRYFK